MVIVANISAAEGKINAPAESTTLATIKYAR
ncbi:hypothetical protein BVI1335_1650015 [Burkholderia vietnamiensis]|nr:hypothetical protein BVI1335_1650015 [Burkholderia vietnamiensis]